MIEHYIIKRSEVSAYVANKELQYLRALFNYGVKKGLVTNNPTVILDFIPVERTQRYVPPKKDVLKVILAADSDTQDYLWTIILTAGRVGEINSLEWKDVNFQSRSVTLWTRKRKGGNKEPRYIPMIPKLHSILYGRYQKKDPKVNWVFWHTHWSRKANCKVSGPYANRKSIMGTLCNKADVEYFRFHALRHLTASLLDDLIIPIGTIQRILGHKNRRTTEIYLHSIGEAERLAMEKLGQDDLFIDELAVDHDQPTNMHTSYWQRKVNRPPYEQLKCEIDNLGYTRTGKKYGVSDNAIRKWLKHYEGQNPVSKYPEEGVVLGSGK